RPERVDDPVLHVHGDGDRGAAGAEAGTHQDDAGHDVVDVGGAGRRPGWGGAATSGARAASRSASSRYCVVSRTVVPSPTRSRTISQTCSRLHGSRPVVGSSRKLIQGRLERELT